MDNKINEKNIFVNLEVLDEMIWQDATTNTKVLLILDSRDDVFNVKSKIKYKYVSYFPKYEINNKFLNTLKESKIENIVLLPLNSYDFLSIELINNGFNVTILDITTKEILLKNLEELTKVINNKTKSYYDHWLENLSRKSDFIANPTGLEIKITNLLKQLNFENLNHIPFNTWLTQTIQLDNGCGEPLIFNLMKKSIINYTIKNGE